MWNPMSRRGFLSAAASASLATLAIGASPTRAPGARRPLVVSSNPNALEKTMELIKQGLDPLDAAIAGVAIIEADPKDHSVGYGGLPNEDGVVELDAAVMHGPTHGGGAVASIRNIIHPAAVARLVMKRTKHCLISAEGALRFARAHGFPETELLTEESRKIWLRWKEKHSEDWLSQPEGQVDPAVLEALKTRIHGTVHVSAMDTHGDLGCVTTTSGLAFKIPGRIGDSPILGAGLYLDNTVGSCGSTGLGEVNLLNCSSYLIIEGIRRGEHIKDAMVNACKRIVETTTRDPRFRKTDGKAAFGVNFYGMTKEGEVAGACIGGGGTFAIHDGDSIKKVDFAVVNG
jgi:N4-(beta-N-acetylglucosaminyl)-L-asparaginase